jgi:hypothetical protein
MNSKEGGGFFDKFKKIIGINSNNNKKSDDLSQKQNTEQKKQNDEKQKEPKKQETQKSDKIHANDDNDSGVKIGNSPDLAKKQKTNEGKPAFNDGKSSSLTEKFQKKGVAPKKSLKEIAEEAEKKKKEEEGKAFSEGDAAQKALKTKSQGFEKVVKKKRNPLEGKVFLVRGKDNGRAAWHYVLVSKEREIELKKQRAGTNIDVADYGKIIKSGWGEEPSDEIKKQIEEEYGS